MKLKVIVLPGLALLVSMGLAACGGSESKMERSTTTTTVTMGQELIDLEKSYKQGIISEKEYEKAKEAILERYQ